MRVLGLVCIFYLSCFSLALPSAVERSSAFPMNALDIRAPISKNRTSLKASSSPLSARPNPPYYYQISDEPMYIKFTRYGRPIPSADGNLFTYVSTYP